MRFDVFASLCQIIAHISILYSFVNWVFGNSNTTNIFVLFAALCLDRVKWINIIMFRQTERICVFQFNETDALQITKYARVAHLFSNGKISNAESALSNWDKLVFECKHFRSSISFDKLLRAFLCRMTAHISIWHSLLILVLGNSSKSEYNKYICTVCHFRMTKSLIANEMFVWTVNCS